MIMNLKKKIFNFFSYAVIFSIIVSIFVFFPSKKANAELVQCANSITKEYVIIDNDYSCPSNYALVSGDFNLVGYRLNTTYDPTINNSGNGANGTGSGTGSNGNTSSGTASNGNGTVVISTTTVGATTNTSTNPSNNGILVNGNTNTGGVFGSTSNGININVGGQENFIALDPSLAYGPFVNLDPTDYPYCVLLTHDLYYGIRDSSSGGDVSALQGYLTDRGFLETGATGFYGRATETAVKRFQYRNEINVTATVSSDMRSILKELTCVKYPKVTYVDKPISPSYKTANTTTKVTTATTKKTTVIPATKSSTTTPAPSTYVSITPTVNTSNNIPATPTQNTNTGPTLNNTKLSSSGGTLFISKGKNLFFTFTSNSSHPSICINLGSVDCSNSSNFYSLNEGVNGSLYESTNLSGQWTFTLYGNSSWGLVGNKVNIFLKDNSNSNVISVYTVVISN